MPFGVKQPHDPQSRRQHSLSGNSRPRSATSSTSTLQTGTTRLNYSTNRSQKRTSLARSSTPTILLLNRQITAEALAVLEKKPLFIEPTHGFCTCGHDSPLLLERLRLFKHFFSKTTLRRIPNITFTIAPCPTGSPFFSSSFTFPCSLTALELGFDFILQVWSKWNRLEVTNVVFKGPFDWSGVEMALKEFHPFRGFARITFSGDFPNGGSYG